MAWNDGEGDIGKIGKEQSCFGVDSIRVAFLFIASSVAALHENGERIENIGQGTVYSIYYAQLDVYEIYVITLHLGFSQCCDGKGGEL